MIRFTSLTIKNFLSYGAEPTVIALDRNGTTLILGEDLDNTTSGAGANGVGKTVIINALAYGVYDKPVSNISKDNLVNNINKKHMEVVVEFEKSGNKYKIQRVRKAKSYAAGNYVKLFRNEEDITPDSVANTNKLIEQIIGLPYELFVRIVVFSATHTPFLDLPLRSNHGPNQTDIIEELFDLKTLSEKSTILVEQRKELEQQLTMYKDRVSLLEQEHVRHAAQVKSAKSRVINWETNNNEEIAKLEKKLERISYADLDEQMSLREQVLDIGQKANEYGTLLDDIKKKFKRAAADNKQAIKERDHLQDAKCPYCQQEYADSEKKLQETIKLIQKTEAEMDQLSEELENVEKLYQEQLDLKDATAKKIYGGADLDELRETMSKRTQYEQKIEELRNAVNPYIEPLDELEAIKLEEIDYTKINTLTKKIEHMKFLYKLLTKKDSFVRKVLLNKNLPFLNQRLSHYLTNLGLSHQVEFTHQMTARITQFGREMDFGNLSNGQRARVNIALSFAFRDVLQNLHERINICMLDEVLDVGLDGVGVTAAARMLKRKARDENLSLYIISHRDEIDSAFDHTMTVQLKEGFSQILEE